MILISKTIIRQALSLRRKYQIDIKNNKRKYVKMLTKNC